MLRRRATDWALFPSLEWPDTNRLGAAKPRRFPPTGHIGRRLPQLQV